MELHREPGDEESAGDVTVSAISSDSLAANKIPRRELCLKLVNELEQLLNADVQMDDSGAAKKVPVMEIHRETAAVVSGSRE